MSDNVATRAESAVGPAQKRESEIFLRPPADIFEDAEGITLQLDMPGVSKDRLGVHADRNTLVIEGDVEIELPQQMEALHAEVQSTHYYRSFALSGELDAEKTHANLKDGVLTVKIPKRSELKPRRIQISTT
ncbi:MAG: Hsp20/alpha crystallin family protein [Gemmatimonadota bacterium]